MPHNPLRCLWGFLPFSLRLSYVFPVFLGFPFRLFLGRDGSMSMFASEGRCLFRGRVVASVIHESVLPTGVSTTLCGAFPDAKLGVRRGRKAANLPILKKMKNEKWEMGNGEWGITVASPKLRLFRRFMPHIPLRYMWGFQQFTLLRSVSAYCRSERVGCAKSLLRSSGRGARYVSSGTLTLFTYLSGLKPGATYKSVLSGDGIPSPFHHPMLTASRLL